MCGWGQSLRSAIVTRFRVDVEALDRALAEAVKEAQSASFHDPAPRNIIIDSEQEEMEQRLISKLHAAGQLRPSYLLRALREGRLSLFESAMATLGGFSAEEVGRALAADKPDILATACAAVGLDKSAFTTLLGLVRDLTGGKPGGDVDQARRGVRRLRPRPDRQGARRL